MSAQRSLLPAALRPRAKDGGYPFLTHPTVAEVWAEQGVEAGPWDFANTRLGNPSAECLHLGAVYQFLPVAPQTATLKATA